MDGDGVYRKHRRTMKFQVNTLIKWSLMAVPFLLGAILIYLIIKFDGMTYGLWIACAVGFTVVHVMHTIFYFFEPKYYAKRRKKYLPMWIATGVVGLISSIVMFVTEGNWAAAFIGPLLIVSFVGGIIKIKYTVHKYLIDIAEEKASRRDD